MNNDLLLTVLRRLLTEIVRLRFKNHYARHRQMRTRMVTSQGCRMPMQQPMADEEIRLKIADMEELVSPLLGKENTEKVILAALEDARAYQTRP